MKAKVITALVLVLFAGLAIWSYTTQQNKLQLQNVELQKLNIDKKALESDSVKKKRTIDQLNSRIEELHKSGNADKSKIDELNKQLDNAMQQLQAKAEELTSYEEWRRTLNESQKRQLRGKALQGQQAVTGGVERNRQCRRNRAAAGRQGQPCGRSGTILVGWKV